MAANLKFVLVPWGSDSVGEDVWLLENALVFGLECVFEKVGVSYADLYDQLQGDIKRTSTVRPYSESDLRALASRAPVDTDAIIDGHLAVQRGPETSAIIAIEAAPRILKLPHQTFEAPDAFRFDSFTPDSEHTTFVNVENQERWLAFVLVTAEAILAPFDVEVPAYVGPETLKMSRSWEAFCAFVKGKRGARTIEEKLGYYRQAARTDPNFYWARFNAGQLYKQQQDYHSSRREFLAAVDGAGDDPNLKGEVYFELGLCSIFLGDTKTARNFWDEALSFAPNNPTLLVNIAGTYEQEENWGRAIELHEMALEIDPSYYKALVSLGRLKAQDGKLEEAIPFYTKALELRPDDSLRHAILGGCYLAQGDEVEARSYFTRASELDPPGSRHEVRIDEADAPPSPGDYARQELAKLAEAESKRRKAESKEGGGWRWFNR